MTYFLYNLLLFLAFPFYIIRVLWKNGGFKERFGIYTLNRTGFGIGQAQNQNKKIIWIHAVSVGEVIASKPLISLINKELPDYKVALSTITRTGREMAYKLQEKPYCIFYFPFDFPFAIKKALRKINPSVIVLAETELWPNLLRYSKYFNIPLVLNNGKISETSFTRYKKIRPLLKQILSNVSAFCMQTEEDKNKLIYLGVSPEKITVTGNTKFDLAIANMTEQIKNWDITGRTPVIVAGSTHPKEEEAILESFKEITQKLPEAILILVPRHPERMPEIENLIKEKGYSHIRRTKMNSSKVKEKIILIDVIGELSKIYSVADIVFVGGSIVPIGGHNLLEPAFLSKPIITGPYTFKQKEMVELLKKGEGLIQVKNQEQLKKEFIELLSSPEKRKKLGKNAYNTATSNQGATRKNFEVIEKNLHKF
ncbi:3-deoxy-D-manno-octulosonic acid transferase [bacterium]|nr:3-deoxy-D-manno-octulosonic acid transferase [bacterium]